MALVTLLMIMLLGLILSTWVDRLPDLLLVWLSLPNWGILIGLGIALAWLAED